MSWSPEEEGQTHINAYSKSRTDLGRVLSNFYAVCIETEDGEFWSIEGYWYWLLLPGNPNRDELRELSGWAAKNKGRELQANDYPKSHDTEFRRKICAAADAKIEASKKLRELLTKNTLPIVHYYVYGDKVIESHGSDWLWEHYEQRSKDLKER